MFFHFIDYIQTLLLVNTPIWVTMSFILAGVILFVGESFIESFIPLLYRILTKVASITLIAFGCYIYGKQSVLIPQQTVIERVVTQEKIVTQTIVKYLTEKQKITEDNHAKIIETITTKDDHMCVIPVSFVRVFNDSAADTFSNSPTGIDDSPSGVALSEVERVTADNNATYHEVANRLSALQDWVTKQSEINK